MIKVKADILKNFIVKTTADGTITEAKLLFSPEGLVMNHKDSSGVICICGLLSRANFLEYQEMSFSTREVAKIIQILKMNKDNVINLVSENNLISIITESGGISIPTAEKIESFMENIPGLEYTNKILVKKSTFDDIIEKSKIIESDEVKIINAERVLKMSVGKEVGSAYSTTISPVDEKIEASFNLGYFKSLVTHFDAVLDLSLDGENLPSKFEEKTDKYNVVYFLTPMSNATETPKTE